MNLFDYAGSPVANVYDVEGTGTGTAYDVGGNALTSSNFVVMSYNIQHFTGLNANESMQREIFARYNADFIGFQEFQMYNQWTVPALATTLLSEDYPYLEMFLYGNKNAFASKYAISDMTTVPHQTQTMDGQSYSTGKIEVDGKEVFMVVGHVTTSDYESTKVEQIEEVFDAVQGHERFIIMADFNTTCKSVSDTEYTTIMKQFVDAGYNIANCTPQAGFNNTWTDGYTSNAVWYPCDHIITSANISMDRVVFDTQKITVAGTTHQSIDHIPMIAYLTI